MSTDTIEAVKRGAGYGVIALVAYPLFYLALVGAIALASRIDHEHRRQIVTVSAPAR